MVIQSSIIDIGVDLGKLEGLVEEVRESRDKIPGRWQPILERWANEERTFEQRYQEEGRSWGHVVLHGVANYQDGLAQVAAEERGLSLDLVTPPDCVVLMTMMMNALSGEGVAEEERTAMAAKYLKSERPLELPFNNISALLFAAISRKVHSGQRNVKASTITDVRVISHLAPYSDAMFLDNAMLGLLEENPIRERLGIPTRFFALRTMDAFLDYLAKLEADTLAHQSTYANAIYGTPVDLRSWAAETFKPES